MTYFIAVELSVPAEANERYASLSSRESTKKGYRVIGGDQGDLHFNGFHVVDGRTILDDPELHTSIVDFSDDEANEVAQQILKASFDAIGVEAVEHS